MNSTPNQNNFERALEEARLKLEIENAETTRTAEEINSFATSSVSERMRKELEDLLG